MDVKCFITFGTRRLEAFQGPSSTASAGPENKKLSTFIIIIYWLKNTRYLPSEKVHFNSKISK